MSRLLRSGNTLPVEGHFPSLAGATGWLNSPPLSPEALRGKVILVDFCTYTCINWIRTLPYIRAWDEKYRDEGLVVLGIHTPEFSFERDLDNVRRALRDMRVEYPIAVDSRYAVWDAFANHYWPALYFIDAQGRIRGHAFGEQGYERSEMIIQQLLDDAGAKLLQQDLVDVTGDGPEAPADWENLRSPEEYLGYRRAFHYGLQGRPEPFDLASEVLQLNRWDLAGDWSINAEGVVLNEPGGRIAYQFHARDLHLVMGPIVRGASIPFRVLLDGRPPGSAHGVDIDDDGRGVASYQRMYQLIRQPPPVVERRFEIEFLDSGVGGYAFTFG